MLTYSVKLEDDGGTYLVTCKSLPEVTSVGEDVQEALLNAEDAIETAIMGRIADRVEIPVDTKIRKDEHEVELSSQATLKVLLHNEMLQQGLRKSELARRLEVHMPQVDRLLNVRHSSKLEAMETAFSKLGKRLEVSVA